MRRAAIVVLAVGGLFALGACGLPSVAPSATTPAPAATTAATTTPVAATTTPEATPVVEKRRVTVTRRIPFATRRVNDSTLARGTTKVRIQGRAGSKTLTYEVTLSDGVQTSKKLLR